MRVWLRGFESEWKLGESASMDRVWCIQYGEYISVLEIFAKVKKLFVIVKYQILILTDTETQLTYKYESINIR